MQEEEFRIVEGFDNYQVSNLGIVRNFKTNRILKPGISNGYYQIVLHDMNRKKVNMMT